MGAARPSILDEFDAISSRMREIREAEAAALRCSCSKVISAQGEIITLRSALCRAHPSDEAASYLACPAALDLVQEVERERELLSRIALPNPRERAR